MRRLLVLLAGLLLAMATASPVGANHHIEFIGEVTFETGYMFDGTEVGGLSGAAWDEDAGVYYLLSDDRSQINDARFYTVGIDVSDGSLDDGDVVFLDTTTLLNDDGVPYPALSLDPESLALTDAGTLMIVSEGDANALVSPFVNEYSLEGELIDELLVPPGYHPTADMSSGIRQNLAFESATISPNGRTLTVANEAAMYQDGSGPSLTDSSPARILQYNAVTGRPSAEFVYEVGPIPDEPIPAGSFAVNGLVDLLALDDRGNFLGMERAFSVGVGNSVSIYHVSLQGATDVFRSDITGATPVSKSLLIDLGDLGITLDNLEALALGPELPDGRTPLFVISDNNFNPNGQFTQFLAFALDM